tara:strand:+ start:1112 stop:2464 length:1353 start_codon:yes stop_codon:yes gene_type:complete
MLSFRALSEKKKAKVLINPKMKDVMEGGAPITMHPYSKGGLVKKSKSMKENHGEDCGCMKCEKQRRNDDVNDGPDVQNEAKVDKGRSDYGKASIRNYRRSGPGHDDPGMFDPEGKRGKTIDKRREEHKARRGVKGAKVPAYKRESFQRFVECWKTHKKVGMKMKGGKLVPDCRPKNEEFVFEKMSSYDRNRKAAAKRAAARNAARAAGKTGVVPGVGYVTPRRENETYRDEAGVHRHKSGAKMPKNEETKYEVMSKKKYASTHKDFKGGTKKEPRVSVYDPEKKATVSRLVKFSEMACGDKMGKPTPPNPKAKKQRVANVGLTSEDAYIKNNNENIYGSQKEVSQESNQSSKNETSILAEKDTALDIVKKKIIAQYGKGAIMRKGSNQKPKVKGAKSTVGTNKYKDMADKKKQTAADAKKRGFTSTQNYVDTMARYGGKDNYDKGKGLGT